jgi:hypothetical protein
MRGLMKYSSPTTLLGLGVHLEDRLDSERFDVHDFLPVPFERRRFKRPNVNFTTQASLLL